MVAALIRSPIGGPLEELTGFIALFTLQFTLLHAYFGRTWRGYGHGHAISLFRVVIPAAITAIALVISLGILLSLYLHRLLSHPNHAGSKNELVIVAIAGTCLAWTGVLGADRRRRLVAAKLASVPCFGNGPHAANHQMLPRRRSQMLQFQNGYIAPVESVKEQSITSSVTEITPESSPEGKREVRRTNTTGLTKRRVWEFSCRTASTWVYGRPKRQAWPLNVVRTFRTKGKRFVLIKDETVQDGAGAVLLNPTFTLSRHLDKVFLARVVHEALYRSALCVLHSWHKKFEGKLFQRFAQLPAVICMLNGDLRQNLEKRSLSRRNSAPPEHDRCYVTELIWAVIMVELLDYLQYKRRDLPMLTWLEGLPQWLCKYDASKVDEVVDAMFETWKAGRNCGKYVTKPCNSDCCCHSKLSQSGCGCQCPCICTCP